VNLVSGHGLLSNPPERVQAFTNPLWTLLSALAYWPTKNAYAAGMLLGLVCSVATAALLAFSRRIEVVSRVIAMLALCLSPSFVDYSTSGLENPLSHLLLVAVYLAERRGRGTFAIALLCALLALNRLDHVLLVLPLLVARTVRGGRAGWRRELGRIALGFVPLAAWLCFAVVYYGFPFPNTAYSKLNTTIGAGSFFVQGVWYFVESTTRDPLTLLLIVAGIAAPFLTRQRRLLPFSLGVLLYVAYTLRVGGDFMVGRFLTAPFVLSVALLFREVVPELPLRLELVVGVLVLFVPVASHASPFVDSTATNCTIAESGIADERLCYRTHTGLVANVRTMKYKKHEYYERGVELRKKGAAVYGERVGGLESIAAGPKVRFVDQWGITDPLLARIPYAPSGNDWRIGHFSRELPEGYVESVESGENRIEDPCIASFYDRLRRVTEGPVWSWQRTKDIAYLNFVERTVTACPRARW
jgi:arabinofuranosyltransferase